MKKYISLVLVLVLALSLFAGCGGNQPGTEAIRNTDNVTIAITSEPDSLDPTRGWGHSGAPLLQSTLITYTSDMTFENDLATEYSLSDDGLVWTFQLREDAYFTDGEQLTASDVAYTLEATKAAQSSVDLSFMESAVAEDDFTVVITLSKPTSSFLNTLACTGIVPEHAHTDDYTTNPAVASGPYKFVEWQPQEQIMLEANENYYGEVPSIQNVTIVFMDEDACLAAVKAGKVDLACTAATLATTAVDGYTVQKVQTVDFRGFTLPMTPDEGEVTESGWPIGNNVTCNIEIRQAMAYALNREAIAEVAMNGYATPAYSENDGYPWNNPEVVIEEDVAYAKQLLADAGWKDTDGDGIVEKDGVSAEFDCLYPSTDSARQAVGMAAAEQLLEIGVKVNIIGSSWDDISQKMFSSAVLMGWGDANPYESYALFHSGGALKDDYYNPEGYMSDVTDGYMSAAMEARTTEEAYENWKLAQWDGETGTCMKGECPWVYIVNTQHLYYVRDGLSIGDQPIHRHGNSMPLLSNLAEWSWNS